MTYEQLEENAMKLFKRTYNLGYDQVATLTGFEKQTLYNARQNGLLKPVNTGRFARFDVKSTYRFMQTKGLTAS